MNIARAINAYSQAIVRPVAEAPRFFFAVMLLACLLAFLRFHIRLLIKAGYCALL